VLQTQNPHLVINKNHDEECPDFGCPIYPPELTPEFHQLLLTPEFRQLLSEDSIKKNGEPTFSFGTKTMAMLTQMGKSHYYNQDRSVVIAPFLTSATPPGEPSFLLGVFDGHGTEGHIVASHILRDLPERLADKLNSLGEFPSDQSIVQALNETFVEVDIYAPPNFLLGGSTATVTLRRGSKLYIANAGDSQTILVSVNSTSKGVPEPTVAYMTRRDKATIPEEYNRIVGLGGNVRNNNVTHDSRVIVYSVAARETIMLAMSRSLGDWEWKPVGVTAEPLVDIIDLKEYPNSFLIAASDGIWDRRRREFYAKQFSESFFGGDTIHPLLKVFDVFEKITPKEQTGYRDDMTAIVMKLS
jgi:serine/threonine protein phosphatase PrpC